MLLVYCGFFVDPGHLPLITVAWNMSAATTKKITHLLLAKVVGQPLS
jgi:hypothetical protein